MPAEKKYKCELCHGTGFYGDNGPGIKGNREYIPCECRKGIEGKEEAVTRTPDSDQSNDRG